MPDEHGYPEGFQPQLGALPKIPDRPVMMLPPLVVALPVPPLEVHNLELIADPDMLGNDRWGDCVFAAIENDRRTSRAVLGLPLNKLTATQVTANYCQYTGATTPPGPGAVIQLALEWVRKYGWPGSADKLLVFAEVRVAITPIDQTVSEFHSGVFGVEIDTAQQYASSFWDAIPLSATNVLRGYHATAAGTYDALYTFCKTWGYLARMTPSYVGGKMDGFYVLVWDFEWNSLSFERQTQLVTDYQALTGKTWTGPAPVPPPGAVMAVSTKTTSIEPLRLLDTRRNLGHTGALVPGVPVRVQVTGGPIPATANAAILNVTATQETGGGYLFVGPSAKAAPTSSNLNFPAHDDRANAVPVVPLDATGGVWITYIGPAGTTTHAVADLLGYLEP